VNTKRVANYGQWLGLIFFVGAIIYVLIEQGNAASVLLSSGAFIFTVSTKIKYYKGQRKAKEKYTITDMINRDYSSTL